MKIVSGTSERIFISASIGCNGRCSYCYLSESIYGSRMQLFSADEVIYALHESGLLVEGPKGSLLSFGCCSECLSPEILEETLTVLEYCLELGNYIQLSTKTVIDITTLRRLSRVMKFKNQLSFFISLPIVLESEIYERGTIPAIERIENFGLIRESDFGCVLYVKPVINDITIKSLDVYIQIIKEFEVDCVVGGYLSNEPSAIIADIGENTLYENEHSQTEYIRKELGKYAIVYTHSTDLLKTYRKRSE